MTSSYMVQMWVVFLLKDFFRWNIFLSDFFLITAHAFGKTKSASVNFRVDYSLYKNFKQIQSKLHPASFTVAFIWCALAGRLSFGFTSVCCKTLLLIAELNFIALVRGLAMKMSSRYKKKT